MPMSRGVPYELLSLLSEHPPFQVWRGIDLGTKQTCLIKLLNKDDTPESKATADLVYAAFFRQRKVKCRPVVVARRIANFNGSLAIEYPFLEGAAWRPLSPEILAAHWPTLIAQIALTVDYIHLRGLVHGDLKLENFLVAESNGGFDLRLIDLDFIQEDNGSPKGIVFGTPGFIPPEVLSNERIVAQSDNYSLGLSFKRLLDHSYADPTFNLACERGHLEALVSELAANDYVTRPRFLSDALARHHLIQSDEYALLTVRLLALLAIGLLTTKTRASLRAGNSDRFVSADLRLFGCPPELIHATRAAVKISLCKVLKVWRSLLRQVRIERHAEFFSLTIPDEVLYEALDGLDAIAGRHANISDDANTVGRLISSAREHCTNGEPLRGLRLIRRLLTGEMSCSPLNQTDRMNLQAEAGACAAAANRQDEGMRLLVEAALLAEGQQRLQLLSEAVLCAIRAGNLKQAKAIAAGAMADNNHIQENEMGLRFQRALAWVAQTEGRLDEADRTLTSIILQAERIRAFEVLIIATYTRGVLAWRRGDIHSAQDLLENVLQLSLKYNLPARSVAAYAFLSQLYVETGQFVKAISYGKTVIRLARETHETASLPAVVMAICSAFARLAKPIKARYWLQQLLLYGQAEQAIQPALTYYTYSGYVNMLDGHLEAAKLDLGKLLQLAKQHSRKRSELKARQNLAEIALWEGNSEALRDHVANAYSLSNDVGDSTIRTECLLFETVANLDSDIHSDSKLAEIADTFVAQRAVYRAASVAFYLLLRSQPLTSNLRATLEEIGEYRGKNKVPLFAALTELVRERPTELSSPRYQESAWRRAYQILASGNQFHLAALAAQKVAGYYLETGSIKRAKNYLAQACKHADTLGNRALLQVFSSQLESLTAKTGTDDTVVDSLLAVTELMKELGSYRQVLDRLLKFAVDQTGAERGIIFLKRPDKPGLQPVASYNCDEQSVRELGDFSASIPLTSVTEMTPLFIDNALEDSRTRQYQSVVAHNILSVACIPMVQDHRAVGVLYLDHHALPALFGQDDQKLMSAIANLLVVTITTAKDFRFKSEKATMLEAELGKYGQSPHFIAEDPKMQELMNLLPRVARTSTSILLLGESGTGKEVLCDFIHRESPRAKEAFLKLNCAGLAASLIESELFGISKNVATGVAERKGKFEIADGGTMFLDEIGDMPLEIQAKILRVVEYGEFERVGTSRTVHVDIRFIFATHQNLEEMIAAGKFRQDLYHRMSRVVIDIPPLRDRRSDIPILIEHFISLFSAEKLPPILTTETFELLLGHPWPGNVRQLKNTIEYCCLFYPGEEVAPSQLPAKILRDRSESPLPTDLVEKAEIERIRTALRRHDGNQSKAAASLGISLTTFRRRLKKYGLDFS